VRDVFQFQLCTQLFASKVAATTTIDDELQALSGPTSALAGHATRRSRSAEAVVFRSRQVPSYFCSLATRKKKEDAAHGRGFRSDREPPGFSDRLAIACVSLGSRSPGSNRTCRGFADRSPLAHAPEGRGEGVWG
jgi:hypothetical protein